MRAVSLIDGREVSNDVHVINYQGMPPYTLFPPSTAKRVRTDARTLASRVGYVMGAGDEVPGALRQLGCDVTLLGPQDLARGDLRRFDAIVTGAAPKGTYVRIARPLLEGRVVRGFEGDAAHTYFSVFDQLIVAQKDGFQFVERNRRPPLDNVNCLLSFVYSLLVHDNRSDLESVGLDPAVGFLHRDRPGRPGLALDIMEELRPVLCDRLALNLVNRKQISGKGFSIKESGGVLMDDETRKVVIVAWQEKKKEELLHPFLKEKVPYGLLAHVQALLLARHLRGDLEAYPPFFWS